jgi:hypothetical protein
MCASYLIPKAANHRNIRSLSLGGDSPHDLPYPFTAMPHDVDSRLSTKSTSMVRSFSTRGMVRCQNHRFYYQMLPSQNYFAKILQILKVNTKPHERPAFATQMTILTCSKGNCPPPSTAALRTTSTTTPTDKYSCRLILWL